MDHHDDLLAPKENLTGVTAQLIVKLAGDCPDGLGRKQYTLDALCTLLPDNARQEVEDALFELESHGVIALHRSFSSWFARLTQRFYEQFDHQVMEWSTVEDAVAVANVILAEGNGDARSLHEKTGWSKRRFNPAFGYLLAFFPEGRISRERQPDYPTRAVVVLPEDRAALRRFVNSAKST